MKLYELAINREIVAYAKDKFLIELFLSQRGKVGSPFSITKRKITASHFIDPELLLQFYNGFAITAREMEYITNIGDERRSYLENQILGLRILLEIHGEELTKKERKSIRKTISTLEKRVDMDDSNDFEAIDTIIRQPKVVDEYLHQIKYIKYQLRGEW